MTRCWQAELIENGRADECAVLRRRFSNAGSGRSV